MSEPHGNPSDLHSHHDAGPPEPKTPMWLPALGAVLFLMLGIFLAMSASGGADTPSGSGNSAQH